jgi:cytochrome c553
MSPSSDRRAARARLPRAPRAHLAAAALAALLAAPALAADGPIADRAAVAGALAATPDPALGAYLAAGCGGCHMHSGRAEGIPGIDGWPVERFLRTLAAYRDGLRTHQAMGVMAQGLDDAAMASIAAHLAALPAN